MNERQSSLLATDLMCNCSSVEDVCRSIAEDIRRIVGPGKSNFCFAPISFSSGFLWNYFIATKVSLIFKTESKTPALIYIDSMVDLSMASEESIFVIFDANCETRNTELQNTPEGCVIIVCTLESGAYVLKRQCNSKKHRKIRRLEEFSVAVENCGIQAVETFRNISINVSDDFTFDVDIAQRRAKQPTEDRINVIWEPGYVVLSIADGHGSVKAADFFIRSVPPLILQRVKDVNITGANIDDYKQALIESVSTIFQEIDELFIRSLDKEVPLGNINSGCCLTIIILVVSSSLILSMNVGDSSAYYLPCHGTVEPLTELHSCLNPVEVDRIKAQSSDPSPIRTHKSADSPTVSTNLIYSPLRVGGSLTVTRALGDAYLKVPAHSSIPWLVHLPYISSNPNIQIQECEFRRGSFIVIASDGIWDGIDVPCLSEVLLTNESMRKVKRINRDSGHVTIPSLACSSSQCDQKSALLESIFLTCLQNGLASRQIDWRWSRAGKDKLLRIPAGDERRMYHDDMSIILVSF